jgi:hypothetical protein
MSFEAKYQGWCADCDDRIHVGDVVTYTDDTGTLVHMDCEGLAEPERKVEVCDKCWLTKPCDCEADS